ncbi:hypothetical protein C8K36_1011115 [Rhodococcus sp. OK519]|uniref:hypothetical protein n=1 Tax=Rhodococcus sp. OK519 TaxID=2135729 RepID=UPI000D333AF2|nr:hypothetical protein C8K36_1011115 [Rhodococcus sp. OK519]
MMCFDLRVVTEDSRLVRSARSLADPALAGSLVAVRSVIRGLQTWDYAPRTIAIIALDSGAWCYAWIVGGGARGARARLLGHKPGEKYPTFGTLRVSPDHEPNEPALSDPKSSEPFKEPASTEPGPPA